MTQPPFSDPAGQPGPWPNTPASQPYSESPYPPMPGSQPYPAQTPSQAYPQVPQAPGSQPYPGTTAPASQPYPGMMPGSQPYPGMMPPSQGYPGMPPAWPPADGRPLFQPAPLPQASATRGERSLRTALLGAGGLILLLVIYFTLPGAAAAGVRSAYPTVHAKIAILSGERDSQTVTENMPVQFSAAQSSGNDLTYNWDFGDNSNATGQVVTHTFTQSSQNDTVTLSISDPLGDSNQTGHQDSATLTLRVYPAAPTASFTPSPGQFDGTGIPYSFDASASTGENITQYEWNFGDNSPAYDSYGPTTTHEYTSLGTFTVTLTVTDDVGQTGTSQQTIQVTAPAPQASFTASAVDSFGYVSVDASGSTGYITDYSWKWGDGLNDDSGSNSGDSHYYSNIGTYTITLTVTDAFGRTSSTSHTVDYTGM
jgi:PKD repeat protein